MHRDLNTEINAILARNSGHESDTLADYNDAADRLLVKHAGKADSLHTIALRIAHGAKRTQPGIGRARTSKGVVACRLAIAIEGDRNPFWHHMR
jgi:hypothetical protein